MVTAAGAAGYGIGTLVNKGIGKITGGGDGWLGGWLYDKLHGDEMAKITAPVSFAEINALRVKQGKPPLPPPGTTKLPSPTTPVVVPPQTAEKATTPASANKPMQVSFAPTVQVTVHGDVKNSRQLAQDLMPHLKQLFGEFQQQLQRSALHDAAHV